MTNTYHFSRKKTATDSQARLDLPEMRNISILNFGDYDILIEFENDIDENSVLIPAGAYYDLPLSFQDVRYKCVDAGQSSIIYIYGLKQDKDD